LDEKQCPLGYDVPQDECLAAGQTLLGTNTGSLSIFDWTWLPCGCFIYKGGDMKYDYNCNNAEKHQYSQLVCKVQVRLLIDDINFSLILILCCKSAYSTLSKVLYFCILYICILLISPCTTL